MNRYISIFFIFANLLVWTVPAFGCLSNTINIGLLDNNESKLLAELVSLTIYERTGTNVRLLIYETGEELNKALIVENREDRIDLTVENLEKIIQTEERTNITIVKTEKNTDSLNINDSPTFIHHPLVPGSLDGYGYGFFIFYRNDLLKDFPLLPRLLNKLTKAADYGSYKQLLQYVVDGKKPRNVAQDFLRNKNLI
jgi:glycine betaine/choline ABC-type transport system substrate-binding protein